MSTISQSLENVGKPIWLALMIVAFIWWWPAGIAILAYLFWTGRLGTTISMQPWMPQFWGSGNAAFDEHRADVLKTLQQEQQDFGKFIDDLAKAKDKAEFDQFVAARTAKNGK
jgi:hypothetical protein